MRDIVLHSTIWRNLAIVSAIGFIGACGGSSTSSNSTEAATTAAPVETTAPPTTAAPTTVVPATTAVAVTDVAAVDPSTLGATLGSAIATSLGLKLDDAQQLCVGDGLLAEAGGLEELAKLNTGQLDSTQIAGIMTVFTDCKIDLSGMNPQTTASPELNFDTLDSARSVLIDGLTASGAGTREAAECFTDGMIEALGADEFLRSLNSDEADPAQDDIANKAAAECGLDPSVFGS